MSKITIELSQEDLGTLIICALRYCAGRKTYIVSLILGIVKPFISKLSDKDIGVLLNDYKEQERSENFGDSIIDKPLWIEWGELLQNEQDKRKEGN